MGGDQPAPGTDPSAGDPPINGDGTITDACATDTFIADLEPSALAFQIDTSGSMNCPITDPGCLFEDTPSSGSRWSAFRTAMLGALEGLPDTLATGVLRFPVTFSCAAATPVVAIQPLGDVRTTIVSELNAITDPDGVTPTHDALLAGYEILRARPEENRFLLLATDGAASVCEGCDEDCAFGTVPPPAVDAMVNDVAEALATDGIRTFVIGVPGAASFRTELSRIANSGGTARSDTCSDNGPEYCHYDLTDATVDFGSLLTDTLNEISGDVLACDFAVPTEATVDLNRVNVRVTAGDGTTSDVPRDPSEQNGWNYNEDSSRILLFGPACDSAKSARDGKVDIVYGCPTVII